MYKGNKKNDVAKIKFVYFSYILVNSVKLYGYLEIKESKGAVIMYIFES